MNTVHYKHKVDVNQKEIVQVIRKAGGLVQILSMVDGLTDAQERFYVEWGSCARVGVVRSPGEALKFIGL